MVSLKNWKWCSLLAALPFYGCASLSPQACSNCSAPQEYSYAVAQPHVGNDYPVSYRVQGTEVEGRSKSVDRQTLAYKPYLQQLLGY